jgi:peptidoglycan hydrolase CwlO-like protein
MTYSEVAKKLESFLDDNAERIAPGLFDDLCAVCEEIDKDGLNSETEINELKEEKNELENRIEELESQLEELQR